MFEGRAGSPIQEGGMEGACFSPTPDTGTKASSVHKPLTLATILCPLSLHVVFQRSLNGAIALVGFQQPPQMGSGQAVVLNNNHQMFTYFMQWLIVPTEPDRGHSLAVCV